jgi:hypothetical protein
MHATLLLNFPALRPQLRDRQQNGSSHCLHILKRLPRLFLRKAKRLQLSCRGNELTTYLPKQCYWLDCLDQLLRNPLLLRIA